MKKQKASTFTVISFQAMMVSCAVYTVWLTMSLDRIAQGNSEGFNAPGSEKIADILRLTPKKVSADYITNFFKEKIENCDNLASYLDHERKATEADAVRNVRDNYLAQQFKQSENYSNAGGDRSFFLKTVQVEVSLSVREYLKQNISAPLTLQNLCNIIEGREPVPQWQGAPGTSITDATASADRPKQNIIQ